MPISSIISQPTSNELDSAYRPIAFTVRATATDGGARPPVVYCDVYINGTYYKSQSKSQPISISGSSSDWFFDIQQLVQEVLTYQIGANGGTAIILTTGIICSVFCRFRSSGISSDGFRIAEGTPPVQGTGTINAVAGTGTQSNTLFAVNATLQHEDNQNIAIHLNSFKTGTWASTTYPLTHRTGNYRVCPDSSDYFPIMRTGPAPNCIRLHYRLRNSTTYATINSCSDVVTTCTPVSFTTAPNLPNGTVGAPYSYSIPLSGTAPYALSASMVRPAWMTIAMNLAGNAVNITGTPNVAGANIPIQFTVTNCNGSESLPFPTTINICCIPSSISATISQALPPITGTITLFCTLATGSNGGITQMQIAFSTPTTQDMTLYFGEVVHNLAFDDLRRVGDSIMSVIPAGTILNEYYDAGPLDATKPWVGFVPSGSSSIDIKPPLGDNAANGLWQLDAPQNNTFGGTWECSGEANPLTDIYIKVAGQIYNASFTLNTLANPGITLHNEASNPGSKLTISFTPCAGISSYNIQYRVLGSVGPYTNAGNFNSSPAVFTDSTRPFGTQYEGFIRGINGSAGFCPQVVWTGSGG